MGIHLAGWAIFITLLVGGAIMFNPQIAGIILMSLAFIWIISFYIIWWICRKKHKDFGQEIIQIVSYGKTNKGKINKDKKN